MKDIFILFYWREYPLPFPFFFACKRVEEEEEEIIYFIILNQFFPFFTLLMILIGIILILKSFNLIVIAENVYCTYYRETNEITCGSVTCETHIPTPIFKEENGIDTKLPRGWYRIGTLSIRQDHAWFNLYRRRAVGLGYWDFYTQIPERSCVGHFGLHAGQNIAGSVTVKDKRCFDRLVMQIERKSTTEKFDVFQCRKCIFNSCWLGNRILHEQRTYLTNLRSY